MQLVDFKPLKEIHTIVNVNGCMCVFCMCTQALDLIIIKRKPTNL